MKKIVLFCTAILTLVFISQVTLAMSVTPGQSNYGIVNPGDVINGKIEIGNTSDIPKIPIIEPGDYIIVNKAKRFVDYETPRGLSKYLEITYEDVVLDPGESTTVYYTITLPTDIAPGSYSTAVLSSSKAPEATDNTVGVSARAASLIHLDIAGDANETLELKSFGINENMLLKGYVKFEILLDNTGEVRSFPTGEITIYDENNEQVEGVYAITEVFVDNQEVVVGREDIIPVNSGQAGIYPGAEGVINVDWENRNVDPGIYTAKLKLYYGEDEMLESETKFEIKQNFYIDDLEADSYFSSSLPVSFSSKLINSGTLPVEPTGYFEVKNIFGSQKERIDFTAEELKIAGGEEKPLNNLEWNHGFALGLYTASLHLNVGGSNYDSSTTFWVISWWQAILSVLILLIIVFVIYKSIHGYRVMQKKLKKANKES